MAFLYTNNEPAEMEIKKKSNSQLLQKDKIPRNKFNQENYKTLKIELKKIQISGRIYRVHG